MLIDVLLCLYIQSLSAFKMKVEELIDAYLLDQDEDKIVVALEKLNCPNFFNQVPKVLMWTVVASKKQEQFPAARNLLKHMRSINLLSKIQVFHSFSHRIIARTVDYPSNVLE